MAEYDINITEYLRIFRKRKFIIIIITIFTTVFSAIYISMQPPVYQTSATVKVMEHQSLAGVLTEWLIYTPADIMESQTKIIRGFPIMGKVAERLNMIEEDMSDSEVHNIIAGVQASVSTQTIPNTNIIQITVTSGDPQKAMDVANVVAHVYRDEDLLEKRKQASTARQFIEEQLEALEKRLEKGAKRLNEFDQDIKNIAAADPVHDPIHSKLVHLQFELATLKQQYTDKHPSIIALKNEIKDLENRLKTFSVGQIEYQKVYRENRANKELYSMLKKKLEEARITEINKMGNVSIVDPAGYPTTPISPKKRVSILFGIVLGLFLGLVMVFIVENLDTSIASIEDMERVAKLPVLGILPLVEYYGQEEKNIFERMLSFLPFFKPKQTDEERFYIRLAVYNEPKSPTAESYRNIRTNLKIGPSLKTILVTSAAPREGKTTIVTNLGLAIALSGEKTLLVSSDLRRPAIAKTFGVKREPGLNEVITKANNLDEGLRNVSDIILGGIKLDKITKSPDIENLSILPAGRVPENPAELLESRQVQVVLDELRRRFDVIILDSPPVLPITDASLLAPYVDGVILVYEAGRTPRSALLRAKIQLESSGAKILGVILNHIQQEIEYTSTYPYYYRYKYYYGEKKGKKVRKEVPEKDKETPK